MNELKERMRELQGALIFFTRLPWPSLEGQFPPLRVTFWAWPWVGALVALIGWLVYIGFSWLHVSPVLAFIFAISAMIVATGALHEDGFADCADSFGGSASERRLEIMNDSRIGTYGALALIVVFMIRIGGFSYIAMAAPLKTLALLVLIASASRAMMFVPIWSFRPAKSAGLGAMLKEAKRSDMIVASFSSLVIALLCAMVSGLGLWRLLLLMLVMKLSAFLFAYAMQRRLGGYSGDVLGGTQIVAELAGFAALTVLVV